MPKESNFEPLSKQVTIVVGLTVVGFMAFGLALSFYRNALFEDTLTQLSKDNDQIAGDIDNGYRQLDYFQSDQYKDKFAKENLHKIDPGEKVLIITQPLPELQPLLESVQQQDERKEASYQELLSQMPILEQWDIYFFNRQKIAELKNQL